MRIAINGFGRIGRMLTRALTQRKKSGLTLVAINDLAYADALCHLYNFDSTHGRAPAFAKVKGGHLHLGTHSPQVLNHAHIEQLPWEALGVDLVFECTGVHRRHQDAMAHIAQGAAQVIIGAAPFDAVDASIVMGVNDHLLDPNLQVISGVSCTTQALCPVLHALWEFGICSVMMTEIHAVTADQKVLDGAHRDWRRARSCGANIIPTTSSAIGAAVRVMPDLQGKIAGYSMRVPTQNVAALDLTITLAHKMPLEALRRHLKQASQTTLKGILDYSEAPLVSSDFNGQAASATLDALQMMQLDNVYKLLIWYDNEWGYANRLLDMAFKLKNVKNT